MEVASAAEEAAAEAVAAHAAGASTSTAIAVAMVETAAMRMEALSNLYLRLKSNRRRVEPRGGDGRSWVTSPVS